MTSVEEEFVLSQVGSIVNDLNDPLEEKRLATLQRIGDLAMKDENRKLMGEQQELLVALVSKLDSSHSQEINMAGRALGNLCHQNEDNQKRFAEMNLPVKLLELLKTDLPNDVAGNVTAALVNITNGIDLTETLVSHGAITFLVNQLLKDDEFVVVMSIRALLNLLDDSTSAAFEESSCYDNIVHLIFNSPYAVVRADALTGIVTVTEKSEKHMVQFANQGDNLAKLYKMAKEDPDKTVQTNALAFLSLLAGNVKTQEQFYDKGVVNGILDEVKNTKDHVLLAAQLQLLGFLAVNENIMDVIFKQFPLFIEFAKHNDPWVKSNAAMVIGNICRRDDYCEKMVQSGVLPMLMDIAKQEARTQQLAFSALRNLSISSKTKEAVLKEPGMLELLKEVFEESNNAQALFNAVIMVKNLIMGGASYLAKIIDAGCLSALYNLLERKLEEGLERIHFEASRVFVIIPAIDASAFDKVMEKGGFKPVSILLSTSFDLLHMEALKFIIVSLNHKSETDFRSQIVESGIVTQLIQLLPNAGKDTKPLIIYVLQLLKSNEKVAELLRTNNIVV